MSFHRDGNDDATVSSYNDIANVELGEFCHIIYFRKVNLIVFYFVVFLIECPLLTRASLGYPPGGFGGNSFALRQFGWSD